MRVSEVTALEVVTMVSPTMLIHSALVAMPSALVVITSVLVATALLLLLLAMITIAEAVAGKGLPDLGFVNSPLG